MKPALLIVDIQKAWLAQDERLACSVYNNVHTINSFIRIFRYFSLPVINILHHDLQFGPPPEEPSFEIIEAIAIEPNDLCVIKNYSDAFNRTGLKDILQPLYCDTVVIVGLSAAYCISATQTGAENNNFYAFLGKGAVCSHDQKHIEWVESAYDTISASALYHILK